TISTPSFTCVPCTTEPGGDCAMLMPTLIGSAAKATLDAKMASEATSDTRNIGVSSSLFDAARAAWRGALYRATRGVTKGCALPACLRCRRPNEARADMTNSTHVELARTTQARGAGAACAIQRAAAVADARRL